MALPRLPYTPSRCKMQPRRSTRGQDEFAQVKNPWCLTELGTEDSAEVRQFEVPYVMAVIDRGGRKVHRALKRKQGCHDSRSNHVSLLLLWLRILPIND